MNEYLMSIIQQIRLVFEKIIGDFCILLLIERVFMSLFAQFCFCCRLTGRSNSRVKPNWKSEVLLCGGNQFYLSQA